MSYRNEPAPSLNLRPIRRKARRRGLKAGRAHARGRPHADDLTQLPGRIWVERRFEQHIKEIEADEIEKKRYHQQELRVVRAHIDGLDTLIATHRERVVRLTPLREADRSKPRVEQDLELERDLRMSTTIVDERQAERHDHVVEAERHQAKVEALESAERAWPDRERESRDAVLQEHDAAYLASAKSALHAFLGKLTRPFVRERARKGSDGEKRRQPVVRRAERVEN